MQSIGHVALLVRDYDEAIDYFTRALNFRVIRDDPAPGGKRWVLVAPPNSPGTSILLAQAATADQEARMGDQTGGRVFLFLHTDDFLGDYAAMKARGVHFLEAPRHEPYGMVAVFEDLHGNKWDLLELRDARGRDRPSS